LHLLFFLPLNWILHLLFLPHLLKVLITTQNDILIILIEFILHLLLEWSNFIIKGIIILLFVLIVVHFILAASFCFSLELINACNEFSESLVNVYFLFCISSILSINKHYILKIYPGSFKNRTEV